MKSRMRLSFALSVACAMTTFGCGASPSRTGRGDVALPRHGEPALPRRAVGFSHFRREITLTRAAPRDRRAGVELVRVESDGTAVIHVRETGETLSASPGSYFLGKRGGPYNVRHFGEQGLQLEKSDPTRQTALLIHRWAQPS